MADKVGKNRDKKIVVRRSVFAAAQALTAEAETLDGRAPYSLAENKIDECCAAGDRVKAKFWRDVWTHLMLVEHVGGEIEVLQDGP